MATVQVNGSAVTSSSTNNNNGTAINVGSSSTVLENRSLGATNVGVFASVVYDGDDADKVISAGTFAHDHARGIIRRVTTEIAGQTDNTLRSGALVPSLVQGINKIEAVSTVKTASGIRANKFNRFDGTWAAGYPQTSTDSFGNDDAARASRSAPGEFVYKLGQKVPVLADYSAKNG
jgi:hypothetical protein